MSGQDCNPAERHNGTAFSRPPPPHSAPASHFAMITETRYSIILEHNAEVLLENASMAQVEAFWDANDTRYVGLRMEGEGSTDVRVLVSDEMPEDDEEELFVKAWQRFDGPQQEAMQGQ
ncbi:hypothetical protein [Pseudomonas monteilii]|uniref:hypothetical protein n=1 Tax=Pseudomonas monteilii TaxID=76759 RepID=UPI003AF31CDF